MQRESAGESVAEVEIAESNRGLLSDVLLRSHEAALLFFGRAHMLIRRNAMHPGRFQQTLRTMELTFSQRRRLSPVRAR